MATKDFTSSPPTIKPWLHKASGLWCIKCKSRRSYLGRTKSEAQAIYRKYHQRIARGLKIPDLDNDLDDSIDLLTVEELCNRFMTVVIT